MAKVQFVVELLRTAFGNCDAEIAKYKAIAEDASAQAAAFAQQANELKAALEQGNIDHANELAASQAESAAGLDEITTILKDRINPQAGSDAFSAAVVASPAVETPVAVIDAEAVIGDPTIETPAAVIEAAVDATVEAIEAVSAE